MHYLDAVLAFVVALVVAAVMTPPAAGLARRIGALAMPSERGLATRTTPLLGGGAILVGVVLATVLWMPATIKLPRTVGGHGSSGTVETWTIIAGAAVITLVGAIDDVRNLPPFAKLIGQIA